jgi:hypothetical protein
MYTACITGASLIPELESMMQQAGFANIRIRPKDESKAFIRDWAPGSMVEEYILAVSPTEDILDSFWPAAERDLHQILIDPQPALLVQGNIPDWGLNGVRWPLQISCFGCMIMPPHRSQPF